MDDSGVLHSNERCCIYGGIVFTSKLDQENFERKYKNILNKKIIHKRMISTQGVVFRNTIKLTFDTCM